MIDKSATIEMPLDGLQRMEAARRVLEEMEEARCADIAPSGPNIVPVGDDTISDIRRITNEIDKGGCGLAIQIEARLVTDGREGEP